MPLDPRLDRLAEIAVHVGLGGLKPGQELLMTASVEALPLVRRITEHAYKAGASLVTTLFSDDECSLARYRFAADGSFDVAPGWMFEGMAAAFRGGAARLAVVGDDPSLLAGQDAEKVARANRARSQAYRPALELITASAINWTLVPFASAAWARAVFPDASPEQAVEQLWNALYASTRVDQADPKAAWAAHNAALMTRRRMLNEKRFRALHFSGPGTDLTVGLADNHAWMGGSSKAANGITGNPNIPTEEVFTTPHAGMTEGTVSATKPLAHQGTLIRDIRVRFEGGRIVEAQASAGDAVLQKMISTDEGARRLGEVALVPHSSPISQSGLLFFNTLFDENAASHIALGQAYKKCFTDSESMSDAEFATRGGNSSLIHVDWMIGSAEVDVDGIRFDGGREPVMRKGEWV
ncbi:aminopeptidase [Pseudoroseomonas cervicalis]|uniref:Thermophilic metalloprotease (M29) n=1 Tax=Pseudoroseomonas cervicalis ATCC 49957 TaxID=525371 RepID=D5RHD6_9PROT|nr:aminopeptidase [Pseudoroseomonas cervicalis]EFH13276.1 thermophilic metalloprotease (M29) [Pseudoroseomonas cervicalis ATCC 49957]